MSLLKQRVSDLLGSGKRNDAEDNADRVSNPSQSTRVNALVGRQTDGPLGSNNQPGVGVPVDLNSDSSDDPQSDDD